MLRMAGSAIRTTLMIGTIALGSSAQDEPFDLGSVPLTDTNGGGAVLDAVDILNKMPGTQILTSRDLSGQYHLEGSVLGEDIPPTSLETHETKVLGATPDGYTDASETDAEISLSSEQLRRSAGKTAAVLLHELEHAALAKSNPVFAVQCKSCAEVVCAARASANSCALAQDCSNGLTPAQRADVALGATQENKRCETSQQTPPLCSDCTAPDKPDPIPSCPGPCTPANCD